MIKTDDYLNSIEERLCVLCSNVKLKNGRLCFDINRIAEDFYAALLNKVFGYKLVNGNNQLTNLAVVDLVDVDNRIAVQVTSEAKTSKIIKTVCGFENKNYRGKPYIEQFESLIIFIITDERKEKIKILQKNVKKRLLTMNPRVAFDPEKHLWDCQSIIAYLKSLDYGERETLDRLQKISQFLEENIDFQNSIRKIENYDSILCISRSLTPIPVVNYTVGLIGREGIVKEVCDMLEKDSRSLLITGLGGIGKTAVMQWVCNDILNNGNYVAWIDCGNNLKEDLLVLGKAFGIQAIDVNASYDRIKYVIKKQLEGKLYLFLDNLIKIPDIQLLKELRELNIHILITSRIGNDVLPFFPSIKLEVLAPDMAIKMFYQYYGRNSESEYDWVVNIVNDVGRHTLLVELLAKAARNSDGSLKGFYEKLSKEGVFDVFTRKIQTFHDEDEDLTIEECVMNLYKASELSPEQQYIMNFFTIVPAEKEIFYKVSDWAKFDKNALDNLVDLAWLERGGIENGYRIHQIIRDSLELQLKKKGENLDLKQYGNLIECVTDIDGYLRMDLGYEKARERLLLAECVAWHLYKMFWEKQENFSELGQTLTSIAELLKNIGDVYYDFGDYEHSYKYNQEARVVCERVLGKNNLLTAKIYNNIGRIHRARGNYENALKYYWTSYDICVLVSGMGDPFIATIYNNIGGVYEHQWDYGNALNWYRKALELSTLVSEKEISKIYNNIGVVYCAQGNYAEAQNNYQKALDIREQVYGKNHPVTAMTYSNIGSAYENMGDYGQASYYYEKSFAINKKVLGEDHLFTASDYSKKGSICRAMGKNEKALALYQKSCDIRERALGTNHPLTAMMLNRMGEIYGIMCKYEKAEMLCQKARNSIEQMFGDTSPYMAEINNNMGNVYRKQGCYEQALEWYNKAIEIYDYFVGKEHPLAAITYNNIGLLYSASGNSCKAMGFFRRALDIRKKTLPSAHPYLAESYYCVGMEYKKTGQEQDAKECAQKSLEIWKKVLPLNHEYIKNAEALMKS